jgi:hypothetical protein
MPDMDETSLRRLLDSALVGRPPMGPVVHNALRAGLKLRRRRRIQGAAGGAAAAAIIAVTIPATIGILGHTPGPAEGHRSAGLAGGPKFFAGVAEKPLGQDPRATVVNIYRSATGRVVASIRPPKPYHDFVAVSRLGSDRTYVAAAMAGHSACTSHLFQFSIDGEGHPSGLTPLSVLQVTGQLMELVSSADGKALAFTVSGCTPTQEAGMINLATRQTTMWTGPNHGIQPWVVGSLSLTEDGSRLGFVAGNPAGPIGLTHAYVLPTDSPSGPLMRHATKVLHVPTGVFSVVLSNNGSRAYVETRLGRPLQRPASRVGAVVLSQYSTTTGQRVRRLGQLSPGGKLSPAILFTTFHITVDAAGKHLLAYNLGHRVKAVNLITGHQASTTVSQVPYLDAAFNTAAW